MSIDTQGLEWAIKFHELYERLSGDFGYETRPDTKQFESESKNGRLMIAVCGDLIPQAIAAEHERAEAYMARVVSAELLAAAAETAHAEVERLREKCYYAELSDNAHAAVREFLMDSDVPMAAFIDDHVGNAIAQRDAARAEADALRALLAEADEVLEYVWHQFAVPGKDGALWAGGLSTLEDVEDLRLKLTAALAARAQPPAKTAGEAGR